MTRIWRQWGAAVAAAALLVGCSDIEKKEAKDQAELTRSLVDAAGTAVKQGDPSTAATYYRGALARDPSNMTAAVGLMETLRLTGGLDEARAVAEKALATRPDDPGVLAEAGKVKLATGQLDDAIKLLKRAVAADDKDWKSRSALGLAYDRVGEYAKAEEMYRAALAIAPDNAAVLNNYALSRAMANDLASARELLQHAAASPSADVRVRQNLALIYALSGDMAKAEELTRHDLPPAMVGQTLEYFRQLAVTAKLPGSSESTPIPALRPQDRSAIDVPAPVLASAAPADEAAPAKATRITVTPSQLAALERTLPPSTAEPAPVPAQLAAATPPRVLAAPPAPAQAKPSPIAAATNPAGELSRAGKGFTVQVATYATLASARHGASVFAGKGLTTRVVLVAGREGRTWYVVRAGDFDTIAEAQDVLQRAHAIGCADALVTRHEFSDERKA